MKHLKSNPNHLAILINSKVEEASIETDRGNRSPAVYLIDVEEGDWFSLY